MKKRNGFISMTLVYTFLILFMFLMLAILRTYQEKDKFLETINEQIDNDIGVAKGSRVTLLSKIIEDNMPSSDSEINYFKIANGYYGNGNGLFYMDKKEYDEYYDITGSGATLKRTYNLKKITDENNDGYASRIYYFRGSVDNNHIIFANMCFRIIRTNDDGSIRMFYNGIPSNGKCPTTASYETSPNKASIAKMNFNPSSNKTSQYVNVVSGSTPLADNSNTQSPIIDKLNRWYISHFIPGSDNATNYTDYISKGSVFCNNKLPYDASFFKSKEIAPIFMDEGNLNIYDDSNIKSIITLRCEQKNDRFSISENTILYPIGLLTAQDVALSGAYLSVDGDTYEGGANKITTNSDYYLYMNSAYWTMSPYDDDEVIYVDSDGTMKTSVVTSEYNIVPVISLNPSSVVASGNGKSDNPYVIR